MALTYSTDTVERVKVDSRNRVRAQIAKRIEKYCAEFSREDFEGLVERMARIQCKYEGTRGYADDSDDLMREAQSSS